MSLLSTPGGIRYRSNSIAVRTKRDKMFRPRGLTSVTNLDANLQATVG
jgi:hypothetical protein